MSVISIGTFDGIHVGHRKLFNTMLTLGKQKNLPTVIISFKDHPSYTLGSKYNPALLCPSDIKRQQILKLGIDHVDLLDFTAKLARKSFCMNTS